MYLHPYQIHSVLKTYTNKLIRQKTEDPVRDRTRIPVEGKRRAVIEKVAEDIINKITQIGLQRKNFCEIKTRQKYDSENQPEADNQFVYNSIDTDNQKRTCKFSVKNSSELIKYLNESQPVKS